MAATSSRCFPPLRSSQRCVSRRGANQRRTRWARKINRPRQNRDRSTQLSERRSRAVTNGFPFLAATTEASRTSGARRKKAGTLASLISAQSGRAAPSTPWNATANASARSTQARACTRRAFDAARAIRDSRIAPPPRDDGRGNFPASPDKISAEVLNVGPAKNESRKIRSHRCADVGSC